MVLCTLHDTTVSGASVDPTSQVRSSAILHIRIADCRKLKV
jgi:hypothetical protein